MEILKVFKGTDKDMKCRGMQYEIGKTEKSDDAIRCGNKGFHSCESPLDVLRYYPLRDGNRYFTAEAGGNIDRTGADDSKVSSSELTLKAEISFNDLIKAHFEFTKKKAESGTAGGSCSNLAGGESSLIVGRNAEKAKGGLHSVIVLTEWKWDESGENYIPVCVKAEIVDGEKIKADTWYTLRNGEFVEV